MPLDIYFFNSLAMFIALVVLMIVIFALRKSFPQNMTPFFIGLEALLFTVIIPRVNEMCIYFGLDFFGRTERIILSWAVIFILYFAFVRIWRRRVLLNHIANMLKKSDRYSSVLKQNGDALNGKRVA